MVQHQGVVWKVLSLHHRVRKSESESAVEPQRGSRRLEGLGGLVRVLGGYTMGGIGIDVDISIVSWGISRD